MTIYLALGSNRGDRGRHLEAAIAGLTAAGVRVGRVSPILTTLPVQAPGRRLFQNCVVAAETELPPRVLLRRLRQLERSQGRHGPSGGNRPRTVDVDLIFYGRAKIATRELRVPHARFARRRFVLAPLAAIAPKLRPPGGAATVARLARKLGFSRR